MQNFKIKLRKNALIKTIALRLFFYSLLLICLMFLLYITDLLSQQSEINNFIIYAIFLIISFILVIFFQYLIYTLSFGKKISFNNFVNVLFDKELADIQTNQLNHPIKFIFPEFEFFYELEDSVIDRKDSDKLYKLAENSINEKNAKKIEYDFKNFTYQNLEALMKYDLVIKMKRKGKAIFDDIVEDERFSELEKLVQYTDSGIYYHYPKIKGRKILIFDDSIHYSNSAREIIDLIKRIGYEKILFFTVVAQEESLESLRKQYPESEKIFFLQYETKNEKEYKQFYADYMIGYLDHVNKSLENDHTLIKLKIDTLIKKENFIKMFNEKNNYVYEVERFTEKDNEYKISLECPHIYEKMNKSHFTNIIMDMVKVRFFVKLNEQNDIYPLGTTDINLSPALIPREFNQDFCKKPTNEDCDLNKLINLIESGNNINIDKNSDMFDYFKDLSCINCLINNLTSIFIDDFMKYFENKIKETKSKIIEKKIYTPFPIEIYRLKYVSKNNK